MQKSIPYYDFADTLDPKPFLKDAFFFASARIFDCVFQFLGLGHQQKRSRFPGPLVFKTLFGLLDGGVINRIHGQLKPGIEFLFAHLSGEAFA